MKHSDRIVLTVVLFIGFNSTALSVGLLYLAWSHVEVDAALIGLAGTSLGALGALLATTRGHSEPAGTDADPFKVATSGRTGTVEVATSGHTDTVETTPSEPAPEKPEED